MLNPIPNYIHLSTYYHLLFVSQRTRDQLLPASQDRESRECNHLWVLIQLTQQNADWDWERICNNPATTWERIVSNFGMISKRCNIHYINLGSNPNLDVDKLLGGQYKFPDGHPVHFTIGAMSSRKDFTLRHIELYESTSIYMPLSCNPNITIDYVIRHMSDSWLWDDLSANPGISIRDIVAHPHLPWNWRIISSTRSDIITYLASNDLSHDNMILSRDKYGLGLNKHLTHTIAIKYGIGAIYMFNSIPIDVLKSECLYHPDKTAQDYEQICLIELRRKYPNVPPEVECRCTKCDSLWLEKLMADDLRGLASERVRSYRDVISHPDFNWNFYIISGCTFGVN